MAVWMISVRKDVDSQAKKECCSAPQADRRAESAGKEHSERLVPNRKLHLIRPKGCAVFKDMKVNEKQ